MTSYTRKHADQIRATTIAGEVANIIKQIHLNAPLFTVPSIVFGGGSSGTVTGSCDLSINPSVVSFDVPAGDTGSIAQVISLCSGVAQTVTITPIQPSDPCMSFSVTPSTLTFTAGQCQSVYLVVHYAGCSASSFTFDANISTNLGCNTTLTALGLRATGQVSTNPTFVLEAACTACNWGTCGGTGYGALSYNQNPATNANNNCAGCPGQTDSCNTGNCDDVYGVCSYNLRVRSINGFTGTVTINCASPIIADCLLITYNDCTGVATSISLTAGGTVSWVTQLIHVLVSGNRQGPNLGSFSNAITVTATSGSITRTCFAVAFISGNTC